MSQTKQSKGVVEWARFLLREGATEEALLSASAELQRGFLAQQPGFVRRELLRGEGRRWVDLVYWSDQASAESAMQQFMSSTACSAYFQLIEVETPSDPNAGVEHYAQVESYAR